MSLGKEQRDEKGKHRYGDWRTVRLALFSSGRCEVVYSDGTGAILHPPAAERVTYFCRDGLRQRLLTSCLPKFVSATDTSGTKDELKAKVSAALALRDYFHPIPAASGLGSLGRRTRHHVKLSHVAWPLAGAQKLQATPIHHKHTREDNGEVEIRSTDGLATLVLAPHCRTFAVEWWCNLSKAAEIDELCVPGTASLNAFEMGSHSRLFTSGKKAVGLYHEHVLLSQCFSTIDTPALTWAYPLLLAASTKLDTMINMKAEKAEVQVLEALLARTASQLRSGILDGSIVESSLGTVRSPLPSLYSPDEGSRWSNDDTSPSAAFIIAASGQGPVRVVWSPTSTTWLHESVTEASVYINDPINAVSEFLMSSRQGRFWSLLSSTPGGLTQPEVLFSELLPPDRLSAPRSERHSRFIAEAMSWLRHNKTELISFRKTLELKDPELSIHGGWLLENEHFEPDVGQLSAFGLMAQGVPANRRLIRILFVDSSRLEFFARKTGQGSRCSEHFDFIPPQDGDEFTFLSPDGVRSRRTFGLPVGAEYHSSAARKLLARLAVDPEEQLAASAKANALAEVAKRRAMLLLRGSCLSVGKEFASRDEVGEACPVQALQQCRAACLSIEETLRRVSVPSK